MNDAVNVQDEYQELVKRGELPAFGTSCSFAPRPADVLVASVDILVSRNALAEDEAKYLSEFNAHILGHANVNQRIFYVDRLRKEMSEVKQVCKSLLVQACWRVLICCVALSHRNF